MRASARDTAGARRRRGLRAAAAGLHAERALPPDPRHVRRPSIDTVAVSRIDPRAPSSTRAVTLMSVDRPPAIRGIRQQLRPSRTRRGRFARTNTSSDEQPVADLHVVHRGGRHVATAQPVADLAAGLHAPRPADREADRQLDRAARRSPT